MPAELTKNELLVSGRFAKICGVNKQTLLYYEKLGLFPPCYRDETGRRYYSTEQIDTFHVILALRKIMSLTELKRYIQTRKTEYFLELFDHSIRNLTDQISHLEKSRDMMRKKVELVQEVRDIDTSIIYIQHCPREYLKVSSNTRDASVGPGILSALGVIIQYRVEHDLCLGRAIGGILPSAWLEGSQTTRHQYYYSELAPDAPPAEAFIKAEGNYMIYYHRGDYHTTYLSYPKLLAYAKQNHFKLGPYVYEESLVDETVELNPEHYITKISVPFVASRAEWPEAEGS